MKRSIIAILGLSIAGCHPGDPSQPQVDGSSGDGQANADDLKDPESCEECHPQHYEEWLGSMHAYSSDDPYFRALNALGQERTDGALGDLCVGCHAPMAVREGATTDGLDLDEVPQRLKGVTCYFCHSADQVDDLHNNQIILADDGVMRGAIDDPVSTDDHESGYSALHDGRAMESSDMCGACHDVVLDGLEVERTYREWEASFYADRNEYTGQPEPWSQRCNSCHMPGSDGPIANAEGVRADRRRHDHSMPGPGVVVTDFPDAERAPALKQANREAMEEFRKTALCASLCVEEVEDTVEIVVWLHNETAGHAWPSGAAQDRRAWVELQAFRDDQAVYSSGVIADGEAVVDHADDPDLWWFGNVMYDAHGDKTHFTWAVAEVEEQLLPVAETLGGDPDTWMDRKYEIQGPMPKRVTLRVKLRAMPVDLLDELVEGGHLSQEDREALPTFDVQGAHLDWTPDAATDSETAGSCVSSSASCGSPFI